MTRAVLVALMVAALAAAIHPGAAAQTQRQRKPQIVIVPGQGIGALRVTMTPQQLLDAIGVGPSRTVLSKADPDAMRKACATEELVIYEWEQEGLYFSTDLAEKRLRVLGVYGLTPDYVTDKGIELGFGITDALKAYGDGYERLQIPNCEIPVVGYRYNSMGLQFEVANKEGSPVRGKIFRISVFAPGLFKKP